MRDSNLTDYWYQTARASSALTEEIKKDGRRLWDPRDDSPSLATLKGKARRYGGHYVRSRARLFDKAGVCIEEREGIHGRRVWIVHMPDESPEDAL